MLSTDGAGTLKYFFFKCFYLTRWRAEISQTYISLLKKLASKAEIERLNRIEVTYGLLGKVMERRAGGPGFNSL